MNIIRKKQHAHKEESTLEQPTIDLKKIRQSLTKAGPNCLLGLACIGNTDWNSKIIQFPSNRSRASDVENWTIVWTESIRWFENELHSAWPTHWEYREAKDFNAVVQSGDHKRQRIEIVDQVCHWKRSGNSILNLGYNDTESLSRWGRSCDGVLLFVHGASQDVVRTVRKLKSVEIPWLGYCELRMKNCTADDSAHPSVSAA